MSSSINPQNYRDLNQSILHLWSKFGGPSSNRWWVIARTNSKWGKFLLWRLISITPQNNRELNQGLLYLWSKFSDPSWKGWWVIARTSLWLTHGQTHRQTDAGNDNTQRPKLASGKNEWILVTHEERFQWLVPILSNGKNADTFLCFSRLMKHGKW